MLLSSLVHPRVLPLIALAGGPPTARQIGKLLFLALGITDACASGALNCPFHVTCSSLLIFNKDPSSLQITLHNHLRHNQVN